MTAQNVYRTKKKIKLCKKNKIEISEIESQAPFLLHAKLGAFLAKEKYQVEEEEILSSINRKSRYDDAGKNYLHCGLYRAK